MATGNAKRFVELGVPVPAAKELAAQITAGVGKFPRLLEVGFLPGEAKRIAALINGTAITNNRLAETSMTPRLVKEIRTQVFSGGGSTPDTGGAAVQTNGVTYNRSTHETRFPVVRTGDTSGPKTATFTAGPTILSGGVPTTAADFGGAYPSVSVTWAAGDTSTKYASFSPVTDALPE